MNEAKHTPGPWKVDKNMIRAVDPLTSIACICDVAWPLGNRQECPEANAHLIAAAPDLLESLEAVLEDCGKLLSEFTRGRAIDAVNKAKGIK